MNRIFFFFLLIIISNNIYSQSWTAINRTDKYNYKINNNDTIACTIYVDSIKVIGTDSIFYLNKVFGKCDTCIGGDNNTTVYSNGHSQFLKSAITKNIQQIQFADSASFYIKQFSNLNDTWIFDSIQNISATVVTLNIQSIFNIIDSVKTIVLSTTDTIILSKLFGIIQFPVIPFNGKHYRLVGIEGRNLGLITPKANDIFNYQIGSIFQYKGHYLDPGFNSYYTYQMEVLENLSQQDTIKYRIEKIGIKYDNPYTMDTTGLIASIDTLKITNNSTSNYNSFANELIDAYPVFNGLLASNLYYENMYKSLTSFEDSSGILVRTTNNKLISQHILSNVYTQYLSKQFDWFRFKLVSGIGLVSYDCQNFEQVGWERLEGYVINGDTTGIVYPRYVLTNINTFQNPEKFKYSLDQETLKLFINSSTWLKIYDILGKQVYSDYILNKNKEVNLSFLKSGVYLIVLNDKSKKQTIKYVKN